MFVTHSSAYRIGIDGFSLAQPRGTGVATYGRTLSFALRALGHPVDVLYGMNIGRRTPAALQEVLFFDSLDEDQGQTAPPLKPFSARWFKEKATSWHDRTAFELTLSGRVEQRGFAGRMPAYDRILDIPRLFQRADRHFRQTGRFLTITIPDTPRIMHWTSPLPIRARGAVNLYTIHDLAPLHFPDTTPEDEDAQLRLLRAVCEQADGLCTVSESSARAITSFCPEAAPRLVTTWQSALPDGATLNSSPQDSAKEIYGSFGLRPDSYFLFFGSPGPRKNIGRLVEAFLAAQTSRRLVLVGANGWTNERDLRLLEAGLASGRVVSTEYLPRQSLFALIRHARGVVLPFVMDGSGLPVLEAMATGTPVITSREASLPDIAGEAAILIDAHDVSSITHGLETLDRDDALAARLRREGAVRAEFFSMARYQERLAQMYHRLMQNRHPVSASPLQPRQQEGS